MRGGAIGWGVAVTAAGVVAVLPFVAALGWDGYSHRSQYISELGARGAPDGAAVSVAFLVVGVLFVAWAAVTAPRVATAIGVTGAATGVAVWLAGGGLGASWAVSAFARCQPGCPTEDVDVGQAVHTVVSVVGYTLALAALVVFGLSTRRSLRASARRVGRAGLVAAPVLAAIGLTVEAAGDWRGLLQRVLGLGLLAWIVAVALLVARPSSVADERAPAG